MSEEAWAVKLTRHDGVQFWMTQGEVVEHWGGRQSGTKSWAINNAKEYVRYGWTYRLVRVRRRTKDECVIAGERFAEECSKQARLAAIEEAERVCLEKTALGNITSPDRACPQCAQECADAIAALRGTK